MYWKEWIVRNRIVDCQDLTMQTIQLCLSASDSILVSLAAQTSDRTFELGHSGASGTAAVVCLCALKVLFFGPRPCMAQGGPSTFSLHAQLSPLPRRSQMALWHKHRCRSSV